MLLREVGADLGDRANQPDQLLLAQVSDALRDDAATGDVVRALVQDSLQFMASGEGLTGQRVAISHSMDGAVDDAVALRRGELEFRHDQAG